MKNWQVISKKIPQRIFGIRLKSKLLYLFFLTSIATMSVLAILFWTLQIKSVEMKTTSGKFISSGSAQTLLGDFLLYDDKYFAKKINISEIRYTVADIDRYYPGKLSVVMVEIPEVAYIKNNDTYLIVSENGKILKRQNDIPMTIGEIKMPQTYVAEVLRVGDNLNYREVIFAAQIAKILKSNAIAAFRIELLDSNLIICTLPTTNTTIKFSSLQNSDQSLSRLSDFLEKLYTSGKTIKTLDLRFEKAIIEEN